MLLLYRIVSNSIEYFAFMKAIMTERTEYQQVIISLMPTPYSNPFQQSALEIFRRYSTISSRYLREIGELPTEFVGRDLQGWTVNNFLFISLE
jgi:hypothetical protein